MHILHFNLISGLLNLFPVHTILLMNVEEFQEILAAFAEQPVRYRLRI